MIKDYETYQGVVLRQLVVGAKAPILVSPFRRAGRVNAFVVNETVGVFVKHSSKRLSPWSFTFHVDQVSDLHELETTHQRCFAAFVCGTHGLVTLETKVLHHLVGFEDTRQAWIRIHRSPRSMFGVSGNRGDLSGKVADGVASIFPALQSLGSQCGNGP